MLRRQRRHVVVAWIGHKILLWACCILSWLYRCICLSHVNEVTYQEHSYSKVIAVKFIPPKTCVWNSYQAQSREGCKLQLKFLETYLLEHTYCNNSDNIQICSIAYQSKDMMLIKHNSQFKCTCCKKNSTCNIISHM